MLNNAYEFTAKAWKSRFGVPYSICGCGPTSSGVTQTLSRIFKSGGNNAAPNPKNARRDLISTEEDDADATHPSDHNSVQMIGNSATDWSKKQRRKKFEKRDKELEKGKFSDEWSKLQAERHRRNQHDRAFDAMVPYYGM